MRCTSLKLGTAAGRVNKTSAFVFKNGVYPGCLACSSAPDEHLWLNFRLYGGYGSFCYTNTILSGWYLVQGPSLPAIKIFPIALSISPNSHASELLANSL